VTDTPVCPELNNYPEIVKSSPQIFLHFVVLNVLLLG